MGMVDIVRLAEDRERYDVPNSAPPIRRSPGTANSDRVSHTLSKVTLHVENVPLPQRNVLAIPLTKRWCLHWTRGGLEARSCSFRMSQNMSNCPQISSLKRSDCTISFYAFVGISSPSNYCQTVCFGDPKYIRLFENVRAL